MECVKENEAKMIRRINVLLYVSMGKIAVFPDPSTQPERPSTPAPPATPSTPATPTIPPEIPVTPAGADL